jgi:GT2 family glycosyltransferase/glycosyltransferase involved in cell wall biosynthesis
MGDSEIHEVDEYCESLCAATATSLEMVAALRSQLQEIRARFPERARAPLQALPQPSCPPRRLRPETVRARRDPFSARYPGVASRLAARLESQRLCVHRPSDDDLRRRGATWRMFQMQVRGARRSGRIYRLLGAWIRALCSVALERFRRRLPIPPRFDEPGYVAQYPDVAETVAAGNIPSGYEHWLRHGRREGRPAPVRRVEPNVIPRVARRPGVPADFDDDAYLFHNPDVANAVANGWYRSGYAHWRKTGHGENRGGVWEPPPDRSVFEPLLCSRPYGVNLYGFLSAPSSMGSVARSCAQALDASAMPRQQFDIPDWKYADDGRQLPAFSPYRVNLLQQNADMLPRFARCYGADLLNGCYNVGYWLWELPSFRGDWHHLYNYADEIWTPSEFCRDVLRQATLLPITRVPLVVEGLEKKVAWSREHFQFPNGVFVFGFVFDIASYMERKNPLCLVDAFRREFGDSRDVLLCLKYYNSSHDRTNLRLLEEAISGAPNIRAFGDLMDESELVSLENAMDCVVSPHRSEGFGLTLAEAMYLGKPVIATRYSGNLDFMRDGNSYLLDCTLTSLRRDVGPYRAGNVWAEPSVAHLRRLLREVFEDAEGRRRKAEKAAEDIRSQFSAAAVGRAMARRLDELGLSQPVPPRGILQNRSATRPPPYFHPETPRDVATEIRGWRSKPLISVLTPVYNVAAHYLRSSIESVRTQYYPFWELCLCDDGSTNQETLDLLESYRGVDPRIKMARLERNQGIAAASNRAAVMSTGAWLAMLDDDDELAPEALLEIARAVVGDPEIDFLYTDEDKIAESGERVEHYCKPDWSPEHLLSVNYVLHMLVVRKDLFYAVGQFRSEFSGAQDYDLVLRLAACAQRVRHVPLILYHWRKIPGSAAAQLDAKPDALDAGMRALEDHVRRNALNAAVEPGLLPGLFRVRRQLRGSPLVSLCIIASGRTAEVKGRGTVDLLANLAASIVEKTDYPNYEIVVVDDGNLDEATERSLRGIDHRRVSCPVQQPFNFPRKANFAWRQAYGRHIVLLNDDMEVVSPGWLRAMLEPLQDGAVGVVGAKLYFPDARIQHAGIVLGIHKTAAHVYYGFPADTIGYNFFLHVIRNYSAVTAACMATRIDVLERNGGFDEVFAVDFNDVDFCLRAIQAGYRVVCTPFAEMLHFEGSSLQRRHQDPTELKLFVDRWAAWMACDPHYNPNLTLQNVDFSMDPALEFARA